MTPASFLLLCGILTPADQPPADENLPLCGLPPAKLTPGLSSFSYRISTDSTECQALFDQGLVYFHSRKFQEAAQALETAARLDADCAVVWWALSRALEGWGKETQAQALQKAQALLQRASDPERLLITARLQEKGLQAGGKAGAIKTLDDLLTIYDNDDEAWFCRAQLVAAGPGQVPYLRAVLRINPLHPGANFEMTRFFESDRHAAAVAAYNSAFRKSAPGIVEPGGKDKPATKPARPAGPPAKDAKLPMCGLTPAKITPNLCLLRYRISTRSPECQAHFDQGLGYFYSYVWMEAARSFETAAAYDPDCAIVWWGLSRALEKWSKGNHTDALQRAQELMPGAPLRERLLIVARLQEKGMLPGVTPDRRRPLAAQTLDEMIAVFDDDEEAWFNRAQLADNTARVPFFKALLKINPLHPGGTHELVHFYENYKRPALGWPYAEAYIASSPGLPHAYHMQAHLGTRIGKWEKTSDYSSRAIELEKAYQKDMNVSPKQDSQYSHHLETLLTSLIHDGRFREARAIEAESRGLGYRQMLPWFRLHLAERDWDEAMKIVEQHRKSDATTANYLAALVYLKQGNIEKATAEVEALKKGGGRPAGGRADRGGARVLEVEGWLQCQKGEADAGLKLLAQAVDRTKNDYAHHAWGNGALYTETWGIAALQAGKLDVAEEAFLESLAHDRGSVRGALGMQVVCERQGRAGEAERFGALARRCWAKADPGRLQAELAWLRGIAEKKTNP
jgi:tetratricopeptide (TPR) repeat protein